MNELKARAIVDRLEYHLGEYVVCSLVERVTGKLHKDLFGQKYQVKVDVRKNDIVSPFTVAKYAAVMLHNERENWIDLISFTQASVFNVNGCVFVDWVE